MNTIDVKSAMQSMLAMGLSKVKVAELFNTNTKTLGAVIDSADGSYITTKITLPKSMVAGTSLEEEAV